MTKQVLKNVLLRFSIGRKLIHANRERKKLASVGVKNREELFTRFFETGEWGSEESVSGPGSTVEYTENIVKKLPALLAELRIKQILDAPCGDYNWFRLVKRDNDVQYLGGDIVLPLVQRNRRLYGNSNTRFVHLDIISRQLPQADVWLCRDCLFHLSNHDVFRAIGNFLDSKIRYLLTSTHSECKANLDIPTGDFRLINLERPPFSFGVPSIALGDCIEGFPARKLALWEKGSLAQAMATNKEYQRSSG